MKKIIGYILLVLFFVILYVGETLIFILGDCHWAVIAFAPLGTYYRFYGIGQVAN